MSLPQKTRVRLPRDTAKTCEILDFFVGSKPFELRQNSQGISQMYYYYTEYYTVLLDHYHQAYHT